MLVPPNEDGKIKFSTNPLRALLGLSEKENDEPVRHIQAFGSPGEALRHMTPPDEEH